MYNVLLLGITGAGKSQLCNFLYDDITNSKYKVGISNKSETKINDLILNEEKNIQPLNGKFNLIDTPGGDDSDKGDIKNLEELVKFLKKKGKVDCIILVFNFTQRNESDSVKEYLNKLSLIFTPIEFYRRCLVVLTYYPLDPDPDDEEKKTIYMDEINDILRKAFKIEDKTSKKDYYFINSKRCYDKKKKDYYFNQEQKNDRIAIIQEIHKICNQKTSKPITKFTFSKEEIDKKTLDEKEYYANLVKKCKENPEFCEKLKKDTMSDYNSDKEHQQYCRDNNINRTTENDDICLCGKIAIGAGIIVSLPFVGLGLMAYGVACLIEDNCNIF